MKKAALVKRSPETSPDWTLLIFVNLSTHHFAIILKTLVCLGHLTLQFLRLPSHFEQLCDGVNEPLEVMVTHLLDLSVVVPDAHIQLLHEETMFLTVVHRPGESDDKG